MKMLEVTRIARAGDEGQKWLINPAHILEIGQWEEHSTIYFTNGTCTKVKETVDQLNSLLRGLG